MCPLQGNPVPHKKKQFWDFLFVGFGYEYGYNDNFNVRLKIPPTGVRAESASPRPFHNYGLFQTFNNMCLQIRT